MSGLPIGPNPCSACGREYGEHQPDCAVLMIQKQTEIDKERIDRSVACWLAFTGIDRIPGEGAVKRLVQAVKQASITLKAIREYGAEYPTKGITIDGDLDIILAEFEPKEPTK